MAGVDSAGNWELFVKDSAGQDTGSIMSWKLKFVGGGDDGGDSGDGGTFTVSADPAMAIPDNDETGVTSTIDVSERKNIKAVKVTVLVKHSYIGALTINLKHGALKETLHNMEGGSSTEIVKTYDVSAFNGGTTEGAWDLVVADHDAYGDTGTIESWSIEFVH